MDEKDFLAAKINIKSHGFCQASLISLKNFCKRNKCTNDHHLNRELQATLSNRTHSLLHHLIYL